MGILRDGAIIETGTHRDGDTNKIKRQLNNTHKPMRRNIKGGGVKGGGGA